MGSRRRRGRATPSATAGRACTARRRSATARELGETDARAGDGRRRAADGRRRGVGGDVHLQPGQRRPEHGRDQRQLGARRWRSSAARSRPTTTWSARSPARSSASRCTNKDVEYVPRPERGTARSCVDVPARAREQRCLDAARLAAAGRRSRARVERTSAATRTSSGRSRARRRRAARRPVAPGHRARQAGDQPSRRRRCRW